MKAALGIVAIALTLAAGCDATERLRALGNDHEAVDAELLQRIPDGNAERGRALIADHGCATCHSIPGERGPLAHVGPPLTQFSRRTNIGGSLPNRPDVLVRFLMNAPRELPGTGMPDLDLSEAEARDIAALLYSFR